MTEKLKYKVGDKVLVEAVVIEVDKEDTDLPYRVNFGAKDAAWLSGQSFNQIITIPPKPKIKQVVMDYYTQNISADYDYDEWFERSGMPDGIASWLYYDGDDDILMQRQHALATLITYGPEAVEVEKEKKYLVTLKSTGQLLARTADGFFFGTNDPYFKDSQYEFTKQELIDAGFEGVFDNPMFEVEEVE